ncbi:MAG: hypothetical protein ABIS86_04825 [Streptosporangiaceae bacterium]
MLRIYETRTEQVVGVRPGPFRLYVQTPDDLRVSLTADLLRRTATRLRRQVLVTAAEDVDHADLNIARQDAGEPFPGALSVGYITSDVRVAPWKSHDHDGDPLALRLTLLRARYRDELTITPEGLAAAAGDLARWRAAVASWGTSPSKPIDPDYSAAALAAFSDDLDTPAALLILERLMADPELAPGAKFETALHLDMVLGLDLVRDLGRY